MILHIAALLLWAALPAFPVAAVAQDYPSRPIKLLIHTPPGSLVDVLSGEAVQFPGGITPEGQPPRPTPSPTSRRSRSRSPTTRRTAASAGSAAPTWPTPRRTTSATTAR